MLRRMLLGLGLAGFLSAVLDLAGAEPLGAVSPDPLETVMRSLEFLPNVGAVKSYAGSGTCRECHENPYSSWHRSFHRSMTQYPVEGAVQADFNNVVLTNDATRFVLHRKDKEYWVRLEPEKPGTLAEPTPDPEEIPIGLVSGSHHMQVFWIPLGMGNAMRGFPFTWLIPEKRWVPRGMTFVRPPEMAHQAETWNHVCARCHATATQPNYDRATKTWQTRAVDLGIACEACHGPGEEHLRRMREWKAQGRKVEAGDALAIVNPEKLSPVRMSQVCGFCHSMKWLDRKEGWPERPFSFRPGDNLEDTTPMIRPREVDRQPWLKAVLEKNPEILRDFFWPDGMMRVSGREYNGLIDSPCYKGGQFSCVSCHSMHDSEPDDQLAHKKSGDGACRACHANYREADAVAAHTHHRPGSTGSMCYNCHMPHTTYGVLSAIRAHQITRPRVADELATGRPNACNLCHLDRSLGWTAEALDRWYGQGKVSLSVEESTVADSVRLALAGDAGQRVLMAWHYGWAPALEASGRSWVAPVLGQLLDDPYAAIRCVADRSMRRGFPFLVPSGYDFTIGMESRAPVLGWVIDAWGRSEMSRGVPEKPGPTLVQRGGGAAMQVRFLERVLSRPARPLRLRE